MDEEFGQGAQRGRGLVLLTPLERHHARLIVQAPYGHRTQRGIRPDFEERGHALPGQPLHRIREADRFADLTHPVLRRTELRTRH
ncbi:hypothetical protein, partial [Streptomyces graminilatus]|uniref:hypothetical protein n=1 Tax=Streptomyces graminilatus TaxID=1464070 RepID=UPI0019D6EEF2